MKFEIHQFLYPALLLGVVTYYEVQRNNDIQTLQQDYTDLKQINAENDYELKNLKQEVTKYHCIREIDFTF